MVRLDPQLRHIPLVLCTVAIDVKDIDVLLETLTLALTVAQAARARKDI